MKKKCIALIFPVFEEMHFGKDVFLVPYYLGKKYNIESNIVYPKTEKNKELPKSYRGVNLIPLRSDSLFYKLVRFRSVILFSFLLKNAKKIEILVNFHWTKITFIQVVIYKLMNSKGKCYVKLDTSEGDFFTLNKNGVSFFYRNLYNFFIKQVDLFSCETNKSFNNLKCDPVFGNKIGNKLILMPNGFDDEYLNLLMIEELDFDRKDNLIITVGRIGSPEKNHEMLLHALAHVELRDWKVMFIGPIECNFKEILNRFYQENPNMINSVIFTGPIFSKRVLWEYYAKSKVFVLTSLSEGSPIVYTEAKRFCNYVVSTEFPAFIDQFVNDGLGCVVSQNNPQELTEIIQDIIDEKMNINTYNDRYLNDLSWNDKIENIYLNL